MDTGGYYLKRRYALILLILLAGIVLAVAGCAAPTSTPIPVPTGASGTQQITSQVPSASGKPNTSTSGTTLGSLYKTDQIKKLEYTLTVPMNQSQPITGVTDMEFLGQEMHNGTMCNHVRTTSTMNIPGIPSGQPTVVDSYIDPNNQSTIDNSDFFASPTLLTGATPDTVQIGSKTYDCTKYSFIETGPLGTVGTGYVWSSPQAPAPVQLVMPVNIGNMTLQLTSWS